MPDILQATPADADMLAAIHAASFTSPWSAETIRGLLTQPATLGLYIEHAAFGLFHVVEGEAEILTLATHPSHRRQGFARAIVSAIPATRLFLDVSAANTPATTLYQCLGFTTIRTRKAYYADGTDALVMQKTVD